MRPLDRLGLFFLHRWQGRRAVQILEGRAEIVPVAMGGGANEQWRVRAPGEGDLEGRARCVGFDGLPAKTCTVEDTQAPLKLHSRVRAIHIFHLEGPRVRIKRKMLQCLAGPTAASFPPQAVSLLPTMACRADNLYAHTSLGEKSLEFMRCWTKSRRR